MYKYKKATRIVDNYTFTIDIFNSKCDNGAYHFGYGNIIAKPVRGEMITVLGGIDDEVKGHRTYKGTVN